MIEKDLHCLLTGTGYNKSNLTPEILRKTYEITLEFLPESEFLSLRHKTQKKCYNVDYKRLEANAQVLIINPTRKANIPPQHMARTESFYQRRITIPLELLVAQEATGTRVEEVRVAEFYTGPIRNDDEMTKAAVAYFAKTIGISCSYTEFSIRAKMIGIEPEIVTPAFNQMIEDILRKACCAEQEKKEEKKKERHLKLVR
jgi:hypothetical protein